MESDEKTFPQATQSGTYVPEQSVAVGQSADLEPNLAQNGRTDASSNSPHEVLGARSGNQRSKHETGVHHRQDQGRLHAVRSSYLSRPLLDALRRHGENPRALRKMERDLRAALKPKGALGQLLFDKFWQSLLRLILIARMEAEGLQQKGGVSQASVSQPSLQEGPLPILVEPSENENLVDDQLLDPDVFRRLALIARYDRAASREMYRTLGLLVMMRRDGETGLESCVRTIAGIKNDNGPEDKNA